jgi:hypothetical protein
MHAYACRPVIVVPLSGRKPSRFLGRATSAIRQT